MGRCEQDMYNHDNNMLVIVKHGREIIPICATLSPSSPDILNSGYTMF